MTREEAAEFEACERDAQLWRYFQSEEYRLKGPEDPDLMIVGKDENGVFGQVLTAEEARRRIEEYYLSSFEGQHKERPPRNPGAPRPPGVVPEQFGI